ncbi:MAG: LysE family translocator [Candidatus Izemoplasma sp.]
MIDFLIAGIILGFSAGITPGPLLALIISETIQYDIKAGIRVALSPIVTDLPIVLVTLFILSKLSAYNSVLGIISILGSFLLFYMGFDNFRIKNVKLDLKTTNSRSFLKGVIVNLTSPNPYMFWLTVGGPLIIKAKQNNITSLILFMSGFYALLFGSKILIAILVGRSKSFLNDKVYIYTIRILGGILWIFAIVLFYDGLKLLTK